MAPRLCAQSNTGGRIATTGRLIALCGEQSAKSQSFDAARRRTSNQECTPLAFNSIKRNCPCQPSSLDLTLQDGLRKQIHKPFIEYVRAWRPHNYRRGNGWGAANTLDYCYGGQVTTAISQQPQVAPFFDEPAPLAVAKHVKTYFSEHPPAFRKYTPKKIGRSRK